MLRPLDPHRCPVDQALEVIGGKWKPLILWRLAAGTLRYSELQRTIPGVSQRILTLHLRELERDGLVLRTVYAEVPPRVEYTLTPPARKLMTTMEAMGGWFLANHDELRAVSAAVGQAAEADALPANVRAFRTRK